MGAIKRAVNAASVLAVLTSTQTSPVMPADKQWANVEKTKYANVVKKK